MATAVRSRGDEGDGRMEGKVKILEERMALLERYVELRFCETFQDFAIRNRKGKTGAAPRKTGQGLKDVTNHLQPSSPPPPEEYDIASPLGGGDEIEREEEEQEEPNSVEKPYSLRRKRKPVVETPSKPTTTSRLPRGVKEVKVKISRIDSTAGNVVESVAAKDTSSQEDNITIEEHPIRMEVKAETEQESADDGGGDDYFTFSGDENGEGEEEDDKDDPLYSADPEEPGDDDDGNSSPDKESKTKTPSKRKRATKRNSVVAPPELLVPQIPEGIKACPYCNVHIRDEFFETHVQNLHMKERHLKCNYCDKRFFNQMRRRKHERVHMMDKWGKPCRVQGCDRIFVDSYKALIHERGCIKRALDAGKHVDAEVLDNIRSRSKGVDLKWPGDEQKPNYCPVCRKCISEEEDLQQHLKEHRRWKCGFCEGERMFTTKYHLKKHMRAVHGQKEESEKEDNKAPDENEHADNSQQNE